MIVHACFDGFIVEMDDDEFNDYLHWYLEWVNANMDDDDTKEN